MFSKFLNPAPFKVSHTPCISRKNNLLLNCKQHEKDLLRFLKAAEVQGYNKPH